MRITVDGMFKNYDKVTEIMDTVLTEMGNKLNLPEGTVVKIEGLDFKVVFEIDGKPMYATVPREINGETTNEMLQIMVKLDEEGNISNTVDNEDESFYDNGTIAKAMGKEYEYSEITSEYSNDEIEVIDSIETDEPDDKKAMAVRYKILAQPDMELHRYYKGDKIVSEMLVDIALRDSEKAVLEADYTEVKED